MILSPFDEDQPLLKALYPEGWHNLAGPFAWFRDPEGIKVERSDEYGWVRPVEVLGNTIGSIVRSIDETGLPPKQAYLFCGPGGVGKSVMMELLARTIVTPDLRLATYTETHPEEGEVTITLVDADTGRPFRINPPPPRERSEGKSDPSFFVRGAFEGINSGLTSTVSFLNAGKANKGDLEAVLASTKRPCQFGDKARVFIINELDGFTKSQVTSVKTDVDPRYLPERNYFLADTNHFGKVKDVFDEAAMQRFHVLQFGQWSMESLRDTAHRLFWRLGLTFSPGLAFDEATELIARKAGGSVRLLISACEDLRRSPNGITREAVMTAGGDTGDVASDDNDAVVEYLATTPPRLTKFLRKHTLKHTNFNSFAAALAIAVAKEHAHVLVAPRLGPALSHIGRVTMMTTSPATQWFAAAGALAQLAEAINGQTVHGHAVGASQ